MAHSGHQKIIDWRTGRQHNRAQLIYNVYGVATAIGQQRGSGEGWGEQGGEGGTKRGGDIVAGGRGPGGSYCSNLDEIQTQEMVIEVSGCWKIKENG